MISELRWPDRLEAASKKAGECHWHFFVVLGCHWPRHGFQVLGEHWQAFAAVFAVFAVAIPCPAEDEAAVTSAAKEEETLPNEPLIDAARLAPIVISPLNVALPSEFKVIPFASEPICIPSASISSLTVEPSLSFNEVAVNSTCSVDVLPIVVVPANLAYSVLPDTICTP